jgi:hypothetical protein
VAFGATASLFGLDRTLSVLAGVLNLLFHGFDPDWSTPADVQQWTSRRSQVESDLEQVIPAVALTRDSRGMAGVTHGVVPGHEDRQNEE